MYKKKYIIFFIFISLLPALTYARKIDILNYPSPRGEKLCQSFSVQVNARYTAVYQAKVAAGEDSRRFKAVDDLMHSAAYFDSAAFCYFSAAVAVMVKVTSVEPISSVKVLPESFKITAVIHHHSILFRALPGQNITVEINGDIVHSIHLFDNPPRPPVAQGGDTNVIYFGPGIHRVTSIVIGSNKTVYIAAGAIVQAVIGPNEKYSLEPSGLRNYPPTFILAGDNIKFEGPGIIDASNCPVHARSLLVCYRSRNVIIRDVIFRDPSGWTIPIVQSDQVIIDNVKILGYRANSDGIDICNSRNVTVSNSFIRTNDDLIVIKSWENQGTVDHVIIKKCVLWNQLANALSIGAELRENVSDVLFSDCDIIHDTGREWTLHIFQCDSTRISNIRFENLRVAESHQLISVWIGKAQPSATKSYGTISQVSFKNIRAFGKPLAMELIGGDDAHQISGLTFQNIELNNKALQEKNIRVNNFINHISVDGSIIK